MIPLDQQRQLVARAHAVTPTYDLVRFNTETRKLEIVISPEPSPPAALVHLDLTAALINGRLPTWAVLYRSVISTGDN